MWGMRRSSEPILTTHVGSLIRPAPLLQFIGAKQRRQPYDEQAYQDCLRKSVSEIVERQAEVGIDTPSDGEFGKSISWSQYALERLSGFERRPVKPGAHPFARGADRARFPEFYAELDAARRPPAVCRRAPTRGCPLCFARGRPRRGAPPPRPAPRPTRQCAWRRSRTPARPRSSATSRTSRRRLRRPACWKDFFPW